MRNPIHAPELNLPGLKWFNVKEPLSLEALLGRLVILEFWTFCCINCIQLIPTLRRVEEAYSQDVVVIGVHSPKFSAERDGENVRQAIARYEIVHPVVHDPQHRLWQAYAVRAWPTLVLISPDGKVIGQQSGEPQPEQLLYLVGELIQTWKREGALAPRPLHLIPEPVPTSRFRFPAKLKPVPGMTPRWALADPGHHQMVVLDQHGAELSRIGSGQSGFADGALNAARFNSPQGLVCDEARLFVADTNNHAIRYVDLATGKVTTLAGVGRRGSHLGIAAPAKDVALASPWDLAIDGTQLYFANAGTHQLGVLDLVQHTAAVLAGNGDEDIVDGPALQARLAQPSGLAFDQERRILYFADSETSAVRVLHLDGTPRVKTLVGSGLFDFGHINGPFEAARLQHPLGIALASGDLFVADSYNGALRILDLSRREVRDLDDGRFECQDPVCLPAGEPAGVWTDGADRILLVDSNNHRVVEYWLSDRVYRTWAC
ncbi:MAG: redoxin domain-containing protein [Gammaproteobacteria bacterium]|nr:redoxin domain-containing protein [Gammaproteobacteria bacterium]